MIKSNKNNNLHKAKQAKNDEFYTQIIDIENELKNYKEYFKDKVIFCNCDDPDWSNFWLYFSINFNSLGLKKLISTHFENSKPSYKLEMNAYGETIKTDLIQNGDFRSPECIELLKEADIVVTNPPFSLFREYVEQLVEYDKKFLVIGSNNAITYKEIFKLIKDNKLWLGTTNPKKFKQPNGEMKNFGNINWFTNLEHSKRNEEIILYKTYQGNEEDYPKYDNYDAIEVSKVKDIPIDYEGDMGVPITFLDKYNPKQFEILGLDGYVEGNKTPNRRMTLKNTKLYARIVIKRRVE
jgi:hypothetical protein